MRIRLRSVHTVFVSLIAIVICTRSILIDDLALGQRMFRALLATCLATALYCAVLIVIRRYLPELSFARSRDTRDKISNPIGRNVDVTVGEEEKDVRMNLKRLTKTESSPLHKLIDSIHAKFVRGRSVSDSQIRKSTSASGKIASDYETPLNAYAKAKSTDNSAEKHIPHAGDSDRFAHSNQIDRTMTRIAQEEPKHVADMLHTLMHRDTL